MYLGELAGMLVVAATDQYKTRINVGTMTPVEWAGVELGFMFDNPLNGQRNYAQYNNGPVSAISGRREFVRPHPSTAIIARQTQWGPVPQQLYLYEPSGKMTVATVWQNDPVTDPTTQIHTKAKQESGILKNIAPLAVFVALPVAAAAITAVVGVGGAAGAAASGGAAITGGGAATGGTIAAGGTTAAGTAAAQTGTILATTTSAVAPTVAAAAPLVTTATVTPAATAAGLIGTAKTVIGAGLTAFGAYQKFTEAKTQAAAAEKQAEEMQAAQRFVDAQIQADLAKKYNAEAELYAQHAGVSTSLIPGIDNKTLLIGGGIVLAVLLLAGGTRTVTRYRLRKTAKRRR